MDQKLESEYPENVISISARVCAVLYVSFTVTELVGYNPLHNRTLCNLPPVSFVFWLSAA